MTLPARLARARHRLRRLHALASPPAWIDQELVTISELEQQIALGSVASK